jgi:Family of unknown function (DUF6788)
MAARPQVLEARIARIKTALAALGPLRPGTLSEQYNVCGTVGCRCKADPPQKHGPYYQVSFTWQGKSHSEFVRREDVATVRQQLIRYQRLRSLIDAWIAAALELAQWQRHAARASHEKSRPISRILPKPGARRRRTADASRSRTP